MSTTSPLPVGHPCPAGSPEGGRVVFVIGAFVAEVEAALRTLAPALVVVPDAEPVASAWAARTGFAVRSDPQGSWSREWGVEPGVGYWFSVHGGVVVEAGALPTLTPQPRPSTRAPAPSASRQPPKSPGVPAKPSAGRRPAPSPATTSWLPAIGATLGWCAIAAWLAHSAGPSIAPAHPKTPREAATVATPVAPTVLPDAPGPSPAGLDLHAQDLVPPNLALIEDSGVNLGFGEYIAGDGHPDGWHTNGRQGEMTVRPDPAGGMRFDYSADAKVAFAARPLDLDPGDSVEVSLRFDPGSGPRHPAQVGVAFFNGRQYLEQASRNLEVESPGVQTLALHAAAPVGATKVQLRWNVEAGGKAGHFSVDQVTFRRVNPRSTARFPLQHVLLVTIETLRVDHTGLGGYERNTTPNLVKLAAQGARMDAHYVQAPYTRPSLSSLVSGRYPSQTGVEDNVAMLPESAVTVAERFAGAGYVTGGFLAQFLLNQNFGFNQGFHTFVNFRNDTDADVPWARLQSWLGAHTRDNTFSWMHLFDPHGPYRPPAEVADTFVGDTTWNADKAHLKAGKGAQRGKVIPDYVFDAGELDRRHYVARYDADILYADRIVGQLSDWLVAQGMDQNTLLVVTADHGESMTDHEKYFAHGSLWQNDIHVPLVIWAPGRVKPGTVVSALTEHVDLVPTLLDFAGIPASDLAGTSLRPVLDGGAGPHPFTTTNGAERGIRHEALVAPTGLKVVLSADGQPERAFDIHKDPQEALDVLADRRAEAEALAAAWRADPVLATHVEAPARDVSAEEKAKLEALGYTEGDGAP